MHRHVVGLRSVILGALIFGLAACGDTDDTVAVIPPPPESETGQLVERSRSDQVAAERRERERQRLAQRQGETRFEYVRYAPDLSDASPKACLVFSEPLDTDTDYSIYAPLTEEVQIAYRVEGEKLCLSGLSFASSYTLTLREGLPADDGDLLGREETVQLSFEDRPPYVGFAGSGVILPREDADGLAVETVNVAAVQVSVSRVNERALAFKSVTRGVESAQGRYAYVYGDENPGDLSSPVWSGLMDIESVRNAPVTTIFPLPDVIGDLEPGAYYIEISDAKELNRNDGPPATAKRWVMLTDLALTGYRSGSGLDVTLRSLRDGRVMPNTPVQLIAVNNEVLGEAATGVDGRVSFNPELLSGTGNLRPKLVLATGLKGDTAILDLTRSPVDLSELDTAGRKTPKDVDAYLYTERGIYRPGESVFLTAMMRDRAGRAIANRNGTLITYRPNGMEAARTRFAIDNAGTIQETITLPSGASRGMWRSVIDIDGLGYAGETNYSVEDFVPQRIAVELETEEAPFLAGDDVREIDVASRFLYGAPGAGLTVKAQARIETDPNPFGYDGFQWGRHDRGFSGRILELDDRTTDGAGQATLRLAPRGQGANADIPLRLNTVVSVLEPGGRAVSESVRIPYRPSALYLGTKPGFDGRLGAEQSGSFEIASLNAAGEGVSEELDWKILAIDYHYDWYRENGRWKWRRSRTVRTVNEGRVSTIDGAGQITVSGLDWGRHELIVSSLTGDTQTSRGFYVGWGGSVSDEGVEAPDRVEVAVEDQLVVPGRPAAITIVPPYDGEAQIVVATDRILSVETRQVQASGTQITLPVNEDWGEGAYVMVNVYTPRDPVVQSKPRRAVGVGYVPVNMDARTFEVEIDAPELIRPGRSQAITVSLADGPREKAYVTLAAVDEGILRLTKFSSPDPTKWYYGKKAMGMSLYDDYGRLLDPNLGLPAEVRTGGDQLGGEGLSVVPTQTVALFSGIVEVGRGDKATIDFDIPEFNGELRLMAVAWSESGLGAGAQAMTVRREAPADLILPRFMAPGDEAVATISIDNVELAAGEFTATLDASQPLSVSASALSKTVPQGTRIDQGVRFSADAAGISRMRLSVDGPDNYSVARDYQIETRSAFLPVTRIERVLMEADDTYAPEAGVFADFIPGTAQMQVSFSGLPVDPNALYTSLEQYPYGCTEQTVSRALPLLYADRLLDEGAFSADGVSRDRVQAAVSKILNRQSENGAFGLWREGDGYASPWLGAYTTDFLYRAKQQGYEVPQAALDRAYDAMRNVARGDAWRVYGYDTDVYESRWHDDTEQRLMSRAAPYAHYVLARAGKADLSRLRYLHDRELSEIASPLARAHLGAALAMMGDRSRAASAFDAAQAGLGYDNDGDYYQTPLRDLSGILGLVVEAGFTDRVSELAEKLGDDTPEPNRLTTQEKAFLLVASSGLGADADLRLDVDGLGRITGDRRTFGVVPQAVEQGVSFRLRRGSAPVFRTVMVTGAPAEAPPAASEKLRAVKSVRSLTGGRVDLDDITQGDQLVITLALTPSERRNNPVIVADLLPAGFEIETVLRPADGVRDNRDNGAFAWIGEIDRANTAEARDDRFVAAIDIVEDAKTLAYVVRAVTPGTYTMPGVVAEDMYRPDVFARSRSETVTITPQITAPGGSR